VSLCFRKEPLFHWPPPLRSIMLKALADRLAEAFAERLHEEVSGPRFRGGGDSPSPPPGTRPPGRSRGPIPDRHRGPPPRTTLWGYQQPDPDPESLAGGRPEGVRPWACLRGGAPGVVGALIQYSWGCCRFKERPSAVWTQYSCAGHTNRRTEHNPVFPPLSSRILPDSLPGRLRTDKLRHLNVFGIGCQPSHLPKKL